MDLRFELEGIPELVRDARQLGVSLGDLRTLTHRLGKPIAALAAASAPKRTMRLARSIYSLRSRQAVRVRTRGRVKYAARVHWGADGASGPRFLTRAADALQAPTIAGLRRGIYDLIDKQGWT